MFSLCNFQIHIATQDVFAGGIAGIVGQLEIGANITVCVNTVSLPSTLEKARHLLNNIKGQTQVKLSKKKESNQSNQRSNQLYICVLSFNSIQ